MDDAALVVAARDGDRDAFAAIYDRFADRLHNFCFSLLRDRHAAADAMQDTFVLAAQRLDQLRDPSKLRAWLFAIARNESLRYARARKRSEPTEDAGAEVAAEGADPEATVSAGDAGAIVWDAAAGLSERDRVLLSLHVGEGLEGQELADAVGVSASHSYVLVNRLKQQVERSIGALLVARQGSRDCDELQAVLADWDGTFSPLVRKRVARHVERCEICSETKKRLASPMALLSAMAAVPAPLFLRERTVEAMELASHGAPLPEVAAETGAGESAGAGPPGQWEPGSDGFPPTLYPRPWRLVAVAAAAAVVVGVVAGAWIGLGGEDRDEVVAAASAEAPATTGAPEFGELPTTSTAPPAATPEVEPDPDPEVVAPPPPDPGAPGTDPAPTAPPDTAPPDTQGPVVSGARSDLKEICSSSATGPGPRTTTAHVVITDSSGVASASLTWTVAGQSETVGMSGAGDTWSAPLGPASGFGTLTSTVTATDVHGNTSQAPGPQLHVAEYC